MFQHAGIWQAGSHPPQIYGDYKFLGEIIWNMHAGRGRGGRTAHHKQETQLGKFTTHSYTQNLCLSTIHSVQRGFIYTEHKPKCRLCKMCNPFFYELWVIPSANVFQLVCYIATLCTTKAVDKRVDLICVLLTLAGGEGQGTMLF